MGAAIFSISYNASDGPIRDKMAAQCLLSGISRSLTGTSGLCHRFAALSGGGL